MAANPDTLNEARTLWQRVAAWGLANSIAQKFQIENAVASSQTGKPIEMLPFGNVTVQAPQQPTQSAGGTNPLLAAGLGAALAASGLGLGAYLAKPAAAIVAPALGPENIPLTINWEFTPDGQRTTQP